MPSNINPFSIFTSISQAIRRIGGSGPDLGNVQAQNNNQDTDMFVPNAGNSPGNAAQNTSNAYRNRVSELIRTLRRTDNDTGERVLAARELGNLGPPEATAPLINAFQNDASIDVRIEAGRALTFRAPNQGGLAPPSALSIFTNALRDPDSEIRNIAATAIGQIAESQGGLSADAITSIINILQDPNANSNTRNSVASLLGKIGQNSPQAVTALINALRDTSSGVRSAAATSLGEIGQDSPQAVTALINALQDDDINVRTAAARSLGQARQNSDEAARALVNQLGNNNQAFISNVIDSLVRIGSTTELTTALQNPNASVRRNAAIALGQIEDSSSVPVLINALRDTDAGVRNAAATALGLTGEGSPQAVDALITAFQNDTDPGVRSSAGTALTRVGQGSPRAVNAFINALQGNDEQNRSFAAFALGEIGQNSPQAVTALINATRDTSSRVRRNAIVALGQIGQGSPEAVTALINSLQDTNEYARSDAATALGRIGQNSPAAITGLINALRDTSSSVRDSAAGSLGQIGQGSPEAVTGLINAIPNVGRRAISALLSINRPGRGTPEAITALINIMQNRNANISERGLAARALGLIGEGSQQAINALTSTISNPNTEFPESFDEQLRNDAIIGLSRIATNQHTQLLLNALRNEETRFAAGAGLGRLGENAISRLIEQIGVEGIPSSSIANILTSIGEPAVNSLIRALGNENPIQRASAASILGATSQRLTGQIDEVVESLIPLLSDPDAEVRTAAASALGNIGPNARAALERLREVARNDRSSRARGYAEDAIRNINTED